MAHKVLSDRTVKSLKARPDGSRYEVMDGLVPGFGVRVSSTGRRTFILIARYNPTGPARRAIGDVGALTLDQARQRARDWIDLVRKGIDPATVAVREKVENQTKRANSFAAVVEDFIAFKLPGERKGKEVERDLRRSFLKQDWAGLPVVDVTDLHVLGVINAKLRGNPAKGIKPAPSQARNLLGHAKRLFSWAVDQRVYGLKSSPVETLRPKSIIGKKKSGQRTLNDREIFALWRASGRIGYPHGAVYRLLLLSGLRLNEAADAAKGEMDSAINAWVIPAARMKGQEESARPHAVPLTADIRALFDSLPTFKTGAFVFSTTYGKKPVWMSDKIKKKIDAMMLRTLQAMARKNGEDASAVTLPDWTNHDIRRTVRSHLSRLKISEEAREAVLAHARPGIKGTYDLHDYLDEKREALELWAARLRTIVEPAPSNVVNIRAAR